MWSIKLQDIKLTKTYVEVMNIRTLYSVMLVHEQDAASQSGIPRCNKNDSEKNTEILHFKILYLETNDIKQWS